MSNIYLIPDGQKTIDVFSTTELFIPISGWINSLRASTKLAMTLMVLNKSGNAQCRLGIRTTNDMNTFSTPVSFTADGAQLSTVASPHRYYLDPNGPNDGDIDVASYFQVGILYSVTSGTAGQISVKWYAGGVR